jgi:hypothetical protein
MSLASRVTRLEKNRPDVSAGEVVSEREWWESDYLGREPPKIAFRELLRTSSNPQSTQSFIDNLRKVDERELIGGATAGSAMAYAFPKLRGWVQPRLDFLAGRPDMLVVQFDNERLDALVELLRRDRGLADVVSAKIEVIAELTAIRTRGDTPSADGLLERFSLPKDARLPGEALSDQLA